jgi:hypothetical protein
MSRTKGTAGRLVSIASVAVGLVVGAGAGCGGSGPPPGPPCEAASGNICTIAGTGVAGDGADGLPARRTNLYLPQDVTISPDGRPYIADWNNHRIRAIDAAGTLHIVAGAGELGFNSDDPSIDRLNHPTNVTFDAAGHLVIAAWHNSRIKVVFDASTGEATDTCGTGARGFGGDGGPAPAAVLNLPVAVVYDAAGNLIVSDQANQRLRRVDAATNIITTIAGTGCVTGASCPLGDGGPAIAASFWLPVGQSAQPGGRIDIDGQGNLYVADSTNLRVRKIDAATNIITTIAGTGTAGSSGDGGPAIEATLGTVTDVAAAADGSLYVADYQWSCVRVIQPDGTIATAAGMCGQQGFAGDGGPAAAAKLDRPAGVALDAAGNLYIADTHNNRVRVVYR